jgi:hypothetical protein
LIALADFPLEFHSGFAKCGWQRIFFGKSIHCVE